MRTEKRTIDNPNVEDNRSFWSLRSPPVKWETESHTCYVKSIDTLLDKIKRNYGVLIMCAAFSVVFWGLL